MKVRVALLIVGLSAPALAYLDPVTGGAFLQVLLVIFTSIALGFHRLKMWVLGLFGKSPSEPAATAAVESEMETPPTLETSDAEHPVSV